MKYMLAAVALASLGLAGCASLEEITRGRHYNSVRDLRLAQTDPAAARGRVLAFHGDVLTAESGPNLSALQLSIPGDERPGDPGEVLAVTWPNSLVKLGIARQDHVSVVGRVAGTVKGRNAFGGDVSVLTLDAFALTNGNGETWTITEQKAAYDEWVNGPKR